MGSHVADSGNNRIREISGGIITIVSGKRDVWVLRRRRTPLSTRLLAGPDGVAIDTAGNLFISDEHNRANPQSVGRHHYDDCGKWDLFFCRRRWGRPTSVPLGDVSGLAVDSAGNLFFSDDAQNLVFAKCQVVLSPRSRETALGGLLGGWRACHQRWSQQSQRRGSGFQWEYFHRGRWQQSHSKSDRNYHHNIRGKWLRRGVFGRWGTQQVKRQLVRQPSVAVDAAKKFT